jgi:hypothetical protein
MIARWNFSSCGEEIAPRPFDRDRAKFLRRVAPALLDRVGVMEAVHETDIARLIER